jgi:hypothetical protein
MNLTFLIDLRIITRIFTINLMKAGRGTSMIGLDIA